MLRIDELRQLARTLSLASFRLQMGPFVLVQRPPEALLARLTLEQDGLRTAVMTRRDRLAQEMAAMFTGFDALLVATLPPLEAADTLSVGRLPDCDVVVDDPSVSKRHAELRWDATHQQCSVRDVGSTNGTFVNARSIGAREHALVDGETLSFGDAAFLFLTTPTLHQHLDALRARQEGAAPSRSRL